MFELSLQGVTGFMFDPKGLPLAVIHVVVVVIYAYLAGWGKISLFGKVIALPGGAVPVSLPFWEFLAVQMFASRGHPTDQLIFSVATHMLRVRLLLLGPSIIFALLGGKLICMDNRTWAQIGVVINRCLANHGGACGGFLTLTLVGLFPLLAIFAVLSAAGIQVPVWIAYLGLFPFYFVFAKMLHSTFFGILSDIFGITELPGWLAACVYTLRIPYYQFCAYKGHVHN